MKQRINDWKPEVRSLIKTLRKHGFTIESVDNGETRVNLATVGEAEFLSEAVACDEATLFCVAPDGRRVALWLVFGNAPGELICDYSFVPGLGKVAEEHGEKWFGRPQPTIEV
jgi:hypothetical protein